MTMEEAALAYRQALQRKEDTTRTVNEIAATLSDAQAEQMAAHDQLRAAERAVLDLAGQN